MNIMRKISLAFALILVATSAHADFTGKNAAGTTVTFKNPGDCTSVVCVPETQVVDSTGASIALATSTLQSTINTSIGTTNTTLTSTNTKLDTIITNTGAAIPAGTATIGNVGADPSSGKGTPSSAAINVSTATTTQLVAISGSTKVYVTSFDVIAGGAGNITFVYGTGSSCGTGTTSLTGAYNLTAQAGISKGNGLGALLVVPSGNALCVTTSAAVQMSGSVSYQQF